MSKEHDGADFKNSVTAAFNGEEPRISIEEAQKLINGYLGELQQKAEKTRPRGRGEIRLPRTAARRM